MFNIIQETIPCDALAVKYINDGAFADCYCINIGNKISLKRFINTFYTTKLFKIERTVLSMITTKLTADKDAIKLSLGETESYSIWTVESRTSNQILLRDITGRTRSWLMVKHIGSTEMTTRLYFGSVVIPKYVSENGQVKFGTIFNVISGFHKVYSKLLLHAAYKKLLKEDGLI